MSRWVFLLNRVAPGLWTAVAWAAAIPAYATAAAEEVATPGSPYIAAYVFVFLSIGLALLAVCRASRRGVWQVRGPRIHDS